MKNRNLRAATDATTEQILRAPPMKQRITKLVIWFGGAAIALAIAQVWFFPWLRTWLSVKDAAELVFRLRVVFAGLALSILAAAGYVFYVGRRVLQVGQWPLPGSFVLRDTPVITGRGVRLRAWAMIAWSAVAAVLGIFAALMPELMRAG